jgi:hypothetical protein
MEPIDIKVEYPSGLELTDRAGLSRELGLVDVSERLRKIMQLLDDTEAPPLAIATVDGQAVVLERRVDGAFHVDLPRDADIPIDAWRLPFRFASAWSKDQRQQFGRFCHSLTVAAVVGLVGYFHSTQTWTWGAIVNEVGLAAVAVLSFVMGMYCMNGE